jgi:hypothetical protein
LGPAARAISPKRPESQASSRVESLGIAGQLAQLGLSQPPQTGPWVPYGQKAEVMPIPPLVEPKEHLPGCRRPEMGPRPGSAAGHGEDLDRARLDQPDVPAGIEGQGRVASEVEVLAHGLTRR